MWHDSWARRRSLPVARCFHRKLPYRHIEHCHSCLWTVILCRNVPLRDYNASFLPFFIVIGLVCTIKPLVVLICKRICSARSNLSEYSSFRGYHCVWYSSMSDGKSFSIINVTCRKSQIVTNFNLPSIPLCTLVLRALEFHTTIVYRIIKLFAELTSFLISRDWNQ